MKLVSVGTLIFAACYPWTSSATDFTKQVQSVGSANATKAVLTSGTIWQESNNEKRLESMRSLYSDVEYGSPPHFKQLFTGAIPKYGTAVINSAKTSWFPGSKSRMDTLRPADFIISNSDETTTLDAAIFRVPVYFGAFGNSKSNDGNLPSKLGYNVGTVKGIRSINRARYAHFVAVDVYKPDASAASREFGQHGGTTWLVNTWGVNFESTTTDDFTSFVPDAKQANPRSIRIDSHDLPAFETEYRHTFDRVFAGVKKVDAQDVVVLLPILGVGQFLTAIAGPEDPSRPDATRIAFKKMFFVKMSEAIVAQGFTDQTIKVIVADFGANTAYHFHQGKMTEMPVPVKSKYQSIGVDIRDLFSWAQYFTNAAPKHLFVVNAGDNLSLLGNGMILDPTVEGMMVAGYRSGALWPNSGYLGNIPMRSHAIEIVHMGGMRLPGLGGSAVGAGQCARDGGSCVAGGVQVHRWYSGDDKWHPVTCERIHGDEADLGWGKMCDNFWARCLGMSCANSPMCQRGIWQQLESMTYGNKPVGRIVVLPMSAETPPHCSFGLQFNFRRGRLVLIPLTTDVSNRVTCPPDSMQREVETVLKGFHSNMPDSKKNVVIGKCVSDLMKHPFMCEWRWYATN